MGTEATSEQNDAGDHAPSELETFRTALQTAYVDLKRTAGQRDQLQSALAESLKHNERILQERIEAQLRCRELTDVCLGQQSLIARLFDQLGACIRSLRHVEQLAGIAAPSELTRILRIPGITVRARS